MSTASRALRRRFYAESVLAGISGGLFVLTLFWHDWLEAFGFDPDHGDGSVEWLVVAVLLAASLCLTVLARLEWRRTRGLEAA
ncbi:ABC transporter permease [Angustibacter sp. McL0619]|uniref:ABC transporter permease n=1 Tax=Angustibacter sp. McL0619 TaxID=3415676 RepID=UPI003CF92EFE